MNQNIAVAARELPFLKYQVRDVVRPDHDGLMTASEALKSLDLDYTVEKRPIFVQQKGEKRGRIRIPNMHATVRTDTETVLGVVGDRYQVVQNDILAGLGGALLDTGDALIESGWSLRGGRAAGLTFRIPSADISVPGDGDGALQMFLMLGNSHDGNSSVSGFIGPVRFACLNMLRLFIRSAVSTFKIRHTSGVEGKIAAMRDALGMTFRYKIEFETLADQLVNTKLVESQIDEILRVAFPIKADSTDAQRDKSVQAAILENWQSSPTIEGVRETGWGLVNAANEYFEHLAPVRARSFDAESVRGISILQGTAYQGTNRTATAVLAAA